MFLSVRRSQTMNPPTFASSAPNVRILTASILESRRKKKSTTRGPTPRMAVIHEHPVQTAKSMPSRLPDFGTNNSISTERKENNEMYLYWYPRASG